jgi:hypothetical protein
MGLLGKLFGGKEKTSESVAIAVDCPHATLVPRWDSVQDMGHEDKITRFMCEACHEEFSPQAAAALRDSINERLEASWQEQQAQAEAAEAAAEEKAT